MLFYFIFNQYSNIRSQSYHSFMWTNFFQHIDIDPRNTHIPNGNADDLQAECDEYERKIARLGGIELFLGGIGQDGHIAFCEPGSSLSSRTRVKTLAYDTIVANSRFFGGDLAKVPKMALTVGVGTVMDAREVLLVVTGELADMADMQFWDGLENMWMHVFSFLCRCLHCMCDNVLKSLMRIAQALAACNPPRSGSNSCCESRPSIKLMRDEY